MTKFYILGPWAFFVLNGYSALYRLRGKNGFRQPARLSSNAPRALTHSGAESKLHTSMVAVAQLVRAPDCGSGGRGFESR